MSDDSIPLARAAAQGDGEALRSLLERHLSDVRAFVRLRAGAELRQHESCSDLVQSVCVEILRHGERFQHTSGDAFKRWLFTTALRKIQNRRRFWTAEKRDARRATALPPGEPEAEDQQAALLERYESFASPSRQMMVGEEVARIEAAFDRLSEEHREVITLAHLAGLSRAEIGSKMGKSEEAVRQLLSRALVRLSKVLTEEA